MTRWLVVLLTVFLLGFALWQVKDYAGDRSAADEILAYELASPQGVTVLITGGTEEVVLTSWLVVPQQEVHNPFDGYAYEVHAELVLPSGEKLVERRFEIGSRVSGDPAEPISVGKFAARLTESDEWVTDGRTTRLNISELGNRAARLRVWTPDVGGRSRVLVRLAYEEPRGRIERAILERTLLPAQRRRVVGNSSALGFEDLPDSARSKALASWGRRLTAEGRAGRDFEARRLLIGDFRAELEDEEAEAGFDIGPSNRAIINLRGKVELSVEGQPGSKIFLQEDDRPPHPQVIGSSARLLFSLRDERPRSAIVWSEEPTRVQFGLPVTSREQLLGRPRTSERAGRVDVIPDYRFQRYWRLSPDEPLRFEVAEEQRVFGVIVRGLSETGASEVPVTVAVKWETEGAFDEGDQLKAALPVLGFESAQSLAVSEPERTVLLPPKSARSVLLTGSDTTMVSVWVPEPFMPTSVPDPAYLEQLGARRVWRQAPVQQRATATVLPARALSLLKGERGVSVRVQPRIDNLRSSEGDTIEERALQPAGSTTKRRLYKKSWHLAGSAFSQNAWLSVQEGTAVSVVNRASQSRSERIAGVYRTCAEQLGGRWQVIVDGKPILERPVTATAGSFSFDIPPGTHDLRIDGFGSCGTVLVHVEPAVNSAILTRQTVHEVVRGRPMRIPFSRRRGELSTIVLVVVSEGQPVAYSFGYEIDPKGERQRRGVFLRRITDREGKLTGNSGGQERATLWESGAQIGSSAGSDYLGKERIVLGDDLAEGGHELVLRLQSSTPVWIRAIVAGRVSDIPEGEDP